MNEKYINSFIIKNAGEQEQEVRIKVPLTQVEGANDLKKEADATARKLASLKEELEYQEDILTAQGVILKETITDTYSMREVAGGLNIYDGSLAEVKKIVGDTVARGKNLVDERNPIKILGNWTYKNGIWQGINPYYQSLPFSLSVTGGKTYFISLNLLNGSTGTQNRVLVTDSDGATVLSKNMEKGLGTYSYSFTANTTGIYTIALVGYTEGMNFYFNNLQVEEASEASEYEPYFGMKSATFGSIKSTSIDGKESVLEFPKTELTWGTILDLDNQRIIRETEKLVFTGNENWSQTNGMFYISNNTFGKPKKGTNNKGLCNLYEYQENYTGNHLFVSPQDTPHVYVGKNIAALFKNKETGKIDETAWKSYLSRLYDSGNPLTIIYTLETPIVTTFTPDQIAVGNEYRVYKEGSEQIISNDGEKYGANLTLTQEYILEPGGSTNGGN